MKWLGVILLALGGFGLILKGIVAHYNHAVWATGGGHRSGPLTPTMAIIGGLVFLYFAALLAKEAGAGTETRSLKRRRSRTRR
jgi:hypothetical protein